MASLDHPNSENACFLTVSVSHIEDVFSFHEDPGCVSSVYLMITSADKPILKLCPFEYGGTYPYIYTHTLPDSNLWILIVHFTESCWTGQNTKPFASWIVSLIIYNTSASNVIKIGFISIRHPGTPPKLLFTKTLVTQVTFLGGTCRISRPVSGIWSLNHAGNLWIYLATPWNVEHLLSISTHTLLSPYHEALLWPQNGLPADPQHPSPHPRSCFHTPQ